MHAVIITEDFRALDESIIEIAKVEIETKKRENGHDNSPRYGVDMSGHGDDHGVVVTLGSFGIGLVPKVNGLGFRALGWLFQGNGDPCELTVSRKAFSQSFYVTLPFVVGLAKSLNLVQGKVGKVAEIRNQNIDREEGERAKDTTNGSIYFIRHLQGQFVRLDIQPVTNPSPSANHQIPSLTETHIATPISRYNV